MASQMMRSGVPVQQMAPQPILPGDQDAIIRTLNDVNQGDESKLKAVQDAWNMFDMFNVTPTFDQFLESLMRAFMKLFSETVPQFIQENNTQSLTFTTNLLVSEKIYGSSILEILVVRNSFSFI
ncbi:hypothetical protein ANCDUO_23401 [Ancylostoma duodenale]|uniref:Uncharacterized protein n=1 Tax=Ancylostoma duodenale TaxID=51022 RepID=A0A0C2FDC2_9BILA|nr:hypothetical protein ANCDUO_23401 [Ancylostoma duodenale]